MDFLTLRYCCVQCQNNIDILSLGDCSYNQEESMSHEVGAKFRRDGINRRTPEKVKAIKQFLKTHRVDIGLTVNGIVFNFTTQNVYCIEDIF